MQNIIYNFIKFKIKSNDDNFTDPLMKIWNDFLKINNKIFSNCENFKLIFTKGLFNFFKKSLEKFSSFQRQFFNWFNLKI